MNDFINTDSTLNTIHKGAFLTAGDKVMNTMTIGWLQAGVMWFKKILIVPIRTSRYTKELVDESGFFTVSVPYTNDMVAALAVTGKVSGRDCDKFLKAGITAVRAKSVPSYVVDGCDMYYECKVLHSIPLNKEELSEELANYYPKSNMHTLYFAEIIEIYNK